MKTRIQILTCLFFIFLFHSWGHSGSVDTLPGSYENWRRRIDRLEIIKSFKRTDYAQLVIPVIDTSDTFCILFPDQEDQRKELINQGIRILKNRIKDNAKDIKVTETYGGIEKALILTISLVEVSVQRITVWWNPLAWVEIRGELIDSISQEVLLRFKTRRTNTLRFIRDEEKSGMVIKAIKIGFHEIGGDLNELISSFE